VLSIVICTHNPRLFSLHRVIDALRVQSLATDAWELVVVDNCSREPVREVLDLSWHPSARFVEEQKAGLTHARLRGIRETRGDLIVFVDDDNVLDADYLETTSRIAREHPFVGAWSGQTVPEFETQPPDWTRRYWGSLVIRDLERDSWSNLPYLHDSMPSGAGLCVRREVASRYLALHEGGHRRIVLDRREDSLVSGGDNDLAVCAIDVGMGIGTFHSLRLTHLIPSVRTTEPYLLRLVESIAYSSTVLRSFRPGLYPDPPPISKLRRAAAPVRQLFRNPRDRRFASAVRRGERRALTELESKVS
jgi:glycosyltransferase involved in cell wall biosynthesis